ncbi:nuclear receptor coactivator 7 isoform X3 [Ambystoma mexicanum]|uniref:nuclear receptor coactivator 7 isoform X3 n=1 Tax=Ambystoma mexicanum TaxID=8296 RepID=UPI0037E88DD3
MDSKEEKKDRRQGYFARLKKKKQAKPNGEGTLANSRGSTASKAHQVKEDTANEVSKQITSLENPKTLVEKGNGADEEKKKKKVQAKPIRRTELKRYYSTDDNPNRSNERKDKKMVIQKPVGTTEYTAGSSDTLNSIALKFNITPNKLVELNRLFTHTIVPGQVLFVPDTEPYSRAATCVSASGGVVSASSSDAEYDKLPDADLARMAKPIERVLSSTSEEEEPVVVKFLKMNCRYITDGKGVVGGVMIVTPNNVMFDPHKSDPLVIENGVEEYGLICPMDEVVSIALYSDISHMKIKDALPSPGEWEDLSSEKDINPFSKFKSLNKEKRQQNGSAINGNLDATSAMLHKVDQPTADLEILDQTAKVDFKTLEPFNDIIQDSRTVDPSDGCAENVLEPPKDKTISEQRTKDPTPSGDNFIQFEKTLPTMENDKGEGKETEAPVVEMTNTELEVLGATKTEPPISAQQEQSSLKVLQAESDKGFSETLSLDLCKLPVLGPGDHSPSRPITNNLAMLSAPKELEDQASELITGSSNTFPSSQKLIKAKVCTDENIVLVGRDLACKLPDGQENQPIVGQNIESGAFTSGKEESLLQDRSSFADRKVSEDSSIYCSPEDAFPDVQQDSESEIKLWLLKRMQGPIEDMLPSKEEKSKTPPMFLCIKVGKPMRKSFSAQHTVMVQQYARKRKQPEYWFAVPRERVDHLYTFFVQWSPEVYGKDAKDQGFVVVEKDELNMIDNFFSEPTTKSWEIITIEEAKRRKSVCSLSEDETEEFLPDLKHHSALLEDVHIEKLAQRLPARVQGYPWRLVYSTLEHGTSLKTLYRKMSAIDSPVLLVIKDMDNQVFGAYATHPFKFSDHYYGTGETFLYTFSPDFKVFKWTGENSYFINGDITSLELGGGSGGFGLWLDADLYHGRSHPCETFNNDTLSKKEDFIVQDVEVWTFE